MHELAITKGILQVVIRHAESSESCEASKVVSISLRIGELSDIVDEWMQRYFNYVSRDTIAEGAKIKIERTPVVAKCEDCNNAFPVNISEIETSQCPICGMDGNVHIISGREMIIEEIEVE